MPELSIEREVELQRWRAKEQEDWRIAEQCGLPLSESDKVWAMVQLEMEFYCSDQMRGLDIAQHARRWVETRNPSHIDAAVALCSIAGTRPPPALAALIVEVAHCRLNEEVQSGTPRKLFKEAAKSHALLLMANLCAAGLSLEAAASKAAARLLEPQFRARYTASSLQKLYSRKHRHLEAKLRERFLSDRGAGQLTEWQRIIPQLPDAPPELIGERR